MKLSNTEKDMLAKMLGILDAIFEPINWGINTPTDQACWQRQNKFLGLHGWPGAGMLPWQNRGRDDAEKKRLSRALNSLVTKDLARTSGKEAGLTRAGMDAARVITEKPAIDDCTPGVDFLFSMLGTDAEWVDEHLNGEIVRGYISEPTMCGFEPFPPGKVGELRLPDSSRYHRDCIIPLCQVGLVAFDFKPRFELPLYRLTNAGLSLAEKRKKSGVADPGAWAGLPEKLRVRYGNSDVYFDSWLATFNALKGMRPLDPNRIKHGLPGCMWPDAALPAGDRFFKRRRKG